MARRRLLWKLYLTYVVVILLCILGVAGYALRSLRASYRNQVAKGLEAGCGILRGQLAERFAPDRPGEIDALAKMWGRASRTRVTIISISGQVLGDSEEDPAVMDNHSDRPEVIQAMAGQVGRSVRYSRTLREDMMYIAMAVAQGPGVVGVVRTAVPLTQIEQSLRAIAGRIWLAGLVVAILAAGLAMAVAGGISHSLRRMVKGANQFAGGRLDHKVVPPRTAEFAELADALNRMAARLEEQLQAIDRQNKQYKAVLSSMVEGVMAVDVNQHVIGLNEAAARLFEVNQSQSEGRSLQEVARNVLLERFVDHVLKTGQTLEGEIVLHNAADHHVLLRGSLLRDASDQTIGALIVLNDVTAVRRLENVRRDFVANVSHELRTPITAIQGFVETLREGAIADPEKAEQFLTIVSKQAARLNKIIEDLLALSRIERETETGAIERVSTNLRDVLHSAVADCQVQASERQIMVRLNCAEDLAAQLNPQLIEQAVVNLLDNAIKYSEPGGAVDLDVEQAESETIIRVRDRGCGIPAEHLPRIFERFYCVDKARSRKMGGTGLGLAIVKHIAQAHGGRVGVESVPGDGSVFSIHLPFKA